VAENLPCDRPQEAGWACIPEIGGAEAQVAHLSKTLVTLLAKQGVPAFALCGADGNMVRVRRASGSGDIRKGEAEVVSFNPFWIDAISQQGGIPVVASIGLGFDCQYYSVNADQFAGSCASAWNADALVFATTVEGPKTSDGSVMRWLGTDQIEDLVRNASVGRDLIPKLDACRGALKRGVKRARILPLSQIDSLAEFYFSRIDFGTEVVLAGEGNGQ
jgi:acetylglutamate kinase